MGNFQEENFSSGRDMLYNARSNQSWTLKELLFPGLLTKKETRDLFRGSTVPRGRGRFCLCVHLGFLVTAAGGARDRPEPST